MGKANAPLIILGLSFLIAVGCQLSAAETQESFQYRPTSCLRPTCQEVMVERGDVRLSVSMEGTIRNLDEAELFFNRSGRVVKVWVSEGDKVKEGQAVAKIESSSLLLAMAKEKISLQEAEKSLAELLESGTSEELLRARAAVDLARDIVSKIEDEVDTLQRGSSASDLAEAELLVSISESAVHDVELEIEKLLAKPTENVISEAKAAVALETVMLAEAEKLSADSSKETDSATLNHKKTLFNLAVVKLDVAKSNLETLMLGPRQITLRSRELALQIAAISLNTEEERFEEALKGDATLNEFEVLKLEIEAAKTVVEEAAYQLELAQQGPTELELVEAEVEVSAASLAVKEAERDLDLQMSISSLAVSSEEVITLARRRLALEKAANRLTDLTQEVDLVDLKHNRKILALQRIKLEDAQSDLEALEMGPDPALIFEKLIELENARVMLGILQETADRILSGPTPEEIALRRAEVAAAAANLVEMEESLKTSEIKSPIDGVITDLNVSEGRFVEANELAARIANVDRVKVVAHVNETIASQLIEGQLAYVHVDSASPEITRGIVVKVPSRNKQSENSALREVIIAIESSQGNLLRTGMVTDVEIIIREQPDVLIVPAAALRGSSQQTIVEIVNEGEGSLVEITTGFSNGTLVEIREGLNEGDVVRMRRTTSVLSGNGL